LRKKTHNMNRLQLLISLILLSLFMSSCSPLGYIQFQQEDNYIFTKDELRDYISNNQNPKVVLRVPNSNSSIVEEERMLYNNLYNRIERELLKANFEVRDRGVFQEVLGNSSDLGYEELRKRTNTDLIIELVTLDLDVEYTTNRFYTKSGKEKLMHPGRSRTKYGATVEFKIVLLETNNISGIYRFNYAPCVDGCNYRSGYETIYNTKEDEEISAFEVHEKDQLEEFIAFCTNELIFDLGK